MILNLTPLRTVEGINHLATRYPKCPIVVTSRRAGWKGLLAPTFITMSILDFGWEDIQRFMNNWFGEGSDRARRLKNILSQQVRMQALAANPLLLSLIAIVFERDLELPERRAKLYERCVQVLLTEWDAHRAIKRASRFTTDRKRDLLEDVALHFHCQGLRYFPKYNLLEVIAAYLPTVNIPAEQASLVLDEISAQHGLLKEQAVECYGFLHLTIQEYFAAVSLDKGNQLDLALAHLHNPWWEEVILLLAGMLKDATPLLDAILSDGDDIFFSNLLLAGRCLAGTPRISRVELREQICTGLRTLIENEGQHWLPRAQAAKILCEADEEDGSEYLLSLLGDARVHWQVRTASADALGAAGNRAILTSLLALLPDEEVDQNVRERIADVVINLCDKSATPELLDLLSNQEVPSQIRGRIARALGQLGDQTVISRLLQLLSEESSDHYLPWYCGQALTDLKFTTDPKELWSILRDKNVGITGRWALTASVVNLDRDVASEAVSWLLDDSVETSVRWNVARRLGSWGGETIRDKLQSLYSDEKLDLSLRACIGIALLDLGETSIITEIEQLFVNPDLDSYPRKKVAEALARFGNSDIAEQLLEALQEENLPLFVRLKMGDLLAGLGDSPVARQLLDLLRDEKVESQVRAKVADVLSILDLAGLMANVRALVTDEDVNPMVRGRAANCLVQDKNSVTWLIELLDREDIGEDVFFALYNASRQAGVRVFRFEEGYEVLPLYPGRMQ